MVISYFVTICSIRETTYGYIIANDHYHDRFRQTVKPLAYQRWAER